MPSFGSVHTVRVKLTSERPRLVPAGVVGAGGGGPPCPALCVSLGVSLSLGFPLSPSFSVLFL